jgi:hypothetical protein
MDNFCEKHFKEWIDYTIHVDDKKSVEISIRKLLKDHPDLIEKNYSWPEMRRMAERY